MEVVSRGVKSKRWMLWQCIVSLCPPLICWREKSSFKFYLCWFQAVAKPSFPPCISAVPRPIKTLSTFISLTASPRLFFSANVSFGSPVRRLLFPNRLHCRRLFLGRGHGLGGGGGGTTRLARAVLLLRHLLSGERERDHLRAGGRLGNATSKTCGFRMIVVVFRHTRKCTSFYCMLGQHKHETK